MATITPITAPGPLTAGLMDPLPSGSNSNGTIPEPAPAPAPAPAPTSTGGNYPITPASPGATAAPSTTPPTTAPTAPTATPTTLPPPGPIAANATVEGRLNNLLASDSKYMDLARTYANQESNRRGLMHSSIAIGASQEAAIKSALPIAQQDAGQQHQTDTNHQLYTYDREKTSTASSSERQKEYLTLATAANDRYAQEFSAIQQSSMTATQKAGAVEELKQWKVASDNWLNATFSQFTGTQISQAPFTPTQQLPLAQQSMTDQVGALESYGVDKALIDKASSLGFQLVRDDGSYLSGFGFNKDAYMNFIVDRGLIMSGGYDAPAVIDRFTYPTYSPPRTT